MKNSRQLKQYGQNGLFRAALIVLLFFIFHGSTVASENVKKGTKLNVLFVGIDDLNDWAISKMEGYEGAKTPHLDKLAQRGLLFSNAHCAAPSCGPSRTSLMTGIRPSTSGNYHNGHDWRKNNYLKDVLTLPKYFMKHGYRSIGGGKIFHELEHCRGHNDLSSWDEFFPGGQKQMPKACHPEEKPNRGMVHFDWGATGKEVTEMSDQKVVNWAIGELDKKQDKPFFMAVGIYRPHLPWYVPQFFFDLYPKDKITIPYNKKNWRKGFPKELINMGGSRRGWDKHVLKTNRVKEAIQGYLACVSYADYELGRLMEALDNSAYKDNTVVVLWTDHGWHLGEKNTWAKFTLWEESTRVPLIIRSPSHNNEGRHCTRPVSLMDIYPTLLDLTGLPAYEKNEGQSLLPLINDPESLRSEPAITTLGRRNHSIRSEHFRYIHMANGSEGLFDHRQDSGEWNNLADNKAYEEIKKSLKAHLPKINVPDQADSSILSRAVMPATQGRFVRIELPGDERILSLAEVEVFAGGKNVALKRIATASSAAYGGVPERAVDGNVDGRFANRSVTCTQEPSANPWWEVDLGRTVDMEQIKVYNRTDSLGHRLNGFMLKIMDEKRQVVFSKEVPTAHTVNQFVK